MWRHCQHDLAPRSTGNNRMFFGPLSKQNEIMQALQKLHWQASGRACLAKAAWQLCRVHRGTTLG